MQKQAININYAIYIYAGYILLLVQLVLINVFTRSVNINTFYAINVAENNATRYFNVVNV